MKRDSAPGIDIIVLAGGRGTRLAGVLGDVPKPLANVAGRPFLDHLISSLHRSGVIRSVVLAAGYRAEQLVAYYRDRTAPIPLQIVFEDSPLGTGGAARHALDATSGPDVLVCNGDSLADWDVKRLVDSHHRWRACATLVTVEAPDARRFGTVLTEESHVRRFFEKSQRSGHGVINSGLYCFSRSLLRRVPHRSFSLEEDLLPKLASDGRLRAIHCDGAFIDIGTPESYAHAHAFMSDLGTAR